MAQNFVETAEQYMEAATADATIQGLRAILLLAINCLFDPQKGNIGQQIALATRLVMSLEQKRHDLNPADVIMIRNMHMTVFSLENELATVLDRPAPFPEPVSTISIQIHRVLTSSRKASCAWTQAGLRIICARSTDCRIGGGRVTLPPKSGQETRFHCWTCRTSYRPACV
jgi:hypothetical protein